MSALAVCCIELSAMKRRFRAALIHLIASATIALLAALIVFAVWYPPPYSAIAGGLSLFGLLVSIDVVLGPALTAVIASPGKPWHELRRDVMAIALVQTVAFGYGMYTIALARPVYMVFEVDRLTVVSAADVDAAELPRAPAAFRKLPWTGPRLIAARRSVNSEEMMRSLSISLSGVDISMQPDHWIDYATSREAVLKAAHPVQGLVQRYPEVAADVRMFAHQAGVPTEELRFLPLTARHAVWTALLAGPDARIVGYLPVDGFL